MKTSKIFLLIILISFTLLSSEYSARAQDTKQNDSIKVIVNNNEIAIDVNPVKNNDVILVPVRAVFESLGAKVDWDEENRTALIKSDKINISIKEGDNSAIVNTEIIPIVSKSIIVNDRMLAPHILISRSLGIKVDYAECMNAVFIYGDSLGYKNIAACKAKSMLEEDPSIYLLDVRTQAEYNQKHITGSKLVPLDKLETEIEKNIPDKNTNIIVYCKAGVRSAKAAQILVKLGYKNIFNIVGGIDSWEYGTVQGNK